MTVDLLAATFWPEAAPLGCCHPHPRDAAPAGAEAEPRPECPEAADAAVRAEGFWAAMARHLWHPSDTPAPP